MSQNEKLVVLRKPPKGDPCNRCGQCCREQLCDIAMVVFRPGERSIDGEQADGADVGPCPALEIDGQFGPQTVCGMLRRPEYYMRLNWPAEDRKFAAAYLSPEFQAYLGIGQGCQMDDKSEEIA